MNQEHSPHHPLFLYEGQWHSAYQALRDPSSILLEEIQQVPRHRSISFNALTAT